VLQAKPASRREQITVATPQEDRLCPIDPQPAVPPQHHAELGVGLHFAADSPGRGGFHAFVDDALYAKRGKYIGEAGQNASWSGRSDKICGLSVGARPRIQTSSIVADRKNDIRNG